MDNITYLQIPNKNGFMANVEFFLDKDKFFEKFSSIAEIPSTGILDIVVSSVYKNNPIGKNYHSKKQQYCIQFIHYDSKNGDITYTLANQDEEYDVEDRDDTTLVLKTMPIETAAKMIKDHGKIPHFSVVVY